MGGTGKRHGEQLEEFYAEKGLMIGNTWFKKVFTHKCIWVNRKDLALLDYVLTDRCTKERLGCECAEWGWKR